MFHVKMFLYGVGVILILFTVFWVVVGNSVPWQLVLMAFAISTVLVYKVWCMMLAWLRGDKMSNHKVMATDVLSDLSKKNLYRR